jgi:hypothetical protein
MQLPLECRLFYFEYLILPDFGRTPLGRVVVGVPGEHLEDLRKRFPAHEVRGGDRQTQIAVKDNITAEERGKILSASGLLPGTAIKFQLLSIPLIDFSPSDAPLFESGGKSFWIRRTASS